MTLSWFHVFLFRNFFYWKYFTALVFTPFIGWMLAEHMLTLPAIPFGIWSQVHLEPDCHVSLLTSKANGKKILPSTLIILKKSRKNRGIKPKPRLQKNTLRKKITPCPFYCNFISVLCASSLPGFTPTKPHTPVHSLPHQHDGGENWKVKSKKIWDEDNLIDKAKASWTNKANQAIYSLLSMGTVSSRKSRASSCKKSDLERQMPWFWTYPHSFVFHQLYIFIGISLWSGGISYYSCVPSQLLVHPGILTGGVVWGAAKAC